MRDNEHGRSVGRWLGSAAVAVLVPGLLVGSAGTAGATGAVRAETVIVLPGAMSAEGITAGAGSTFYAGHLFAGDIFRGDARRGTARLFIDAPDGRAAVGMAADLRHGLLFVAGGATGQGYVYSLRSRATVAVYQFAAANAGFINDVALTPSGAWFTSSTEGQLYFVPVGRSGRPGAFRTLVLSGPAAALPGDFNLNGIRATPSGRTLIVAHSANGRLYTVNPRTGASAEIAGVVVPNVDGIELRGRQLWAVQNADNLVSRWRLRGDLSSGTPDGVIESANFGFPTTAAVLGHRLAVVNAHFDTGIPPTAPAYEVIVVRA